MSTLKRVLALSLALVMVLSLNVFAADFTDKDEFNKDTIEAVDMLVQLNVLAGFPDGSFQPNETLTRAQIAKMIYVICNKGVDDGAAKYVGSNTFHDVPAGSWYEGYVEFCYTTGVIIGRGNDSVSGKPVFDPNAAVTGYELAKMLLVVGNYNPNVEGFNDTANWKNNVLRFANNTGLINNYAELMNSVSPRQWAALMMANLLLEVNWATYMGDSLVTDSGFNNVNHKLVGEHLLGLDVAHGIATASHTIGLGAGVFSTAKTFSQMIVRKNTAEPYVFASSAAGNSGFLKTTNDIVDISWDIPNEFLGQEIKIVGQVKNNNLQGNARYNKNNYTVFGAYLTGTTVLTETTRGDLISAFDDDDDDLNDGITITAGNEVDYMTQAAASAWVNAYIIGNDFSTAKNGVALGDDSAAVGVPEKLAARLNGYVKANDASKAIGYDCNGDGKTDFVQVLYTDYSRVSAVNSSRVTLNGNLNATLNVTDMNYDGTVERNQVLAITENYLTGKKAYDIRLVPGTTVTPSTWTTTGAPENNVTSVKLDGDSYKLATRGVYKALNAQHKIYFVDNGFVVYSTDAVESNGSAPADLSVITAIGADAVNKGLAYTLSVKHLLQDGKASAEGYYDSSVTKSIGKDAVIADNELSLNSPDTTQGKNPLTEALVAMDFVRVDADGTDYAYIDLADDLYSNMVQYKDITAIEYEAKTQLVKITDGVGKETTFRVSNNATVFTRTQDDGTDYKGLADTLTPSWIADDTVGNARNFSYGVTKVENLGNFDDSILLVDNVSILVENGTVVAMALPFADDEKIPGNVDRDTYLVVTGTAYRKADNRWYVMAALGSGDGTPVEICVNNIGGTSPSSALINSYQWRFMRYDLTSGRYNLYALTPGGTSGKSAISDGLKVTEQTETDFETDGGFFKLDKTIVITLENKKITISEQVGYVGDTGTIVVTQNPSSEIAKTAWVVFQNGDMKDAVANNIHPTTYTTPTSATYGFATNTDVDRKTADRGKPSLNEEVIVNATGTVPAGTSITWFIDGVDVTEFAGSNKLELDGTATNFAGDTLNEVLLAAGTTALKKGSVIKAVIDEGDATTTLTAPVAFIGEMTGTWSIKAASTGKHGTDIELDAMGTDLADATFAWKLEGATITAPSDVYAVVLNGSTVSEGDTVEVTITLGAAAADLWVPAAFSYTDSIDLGFADAPASLADLKTMLVAAGAWTEVFTTGTDFDAGGTVTLDMTADTGTSGMIVTGVTARVDTAVADVTTPVDTTTTDVFVITIVTGDKTADKAVNVTITTVTHGTFTVATVGTFGS